MHTHCVVAGCDVINLRPNPPSPPLPPNPSGAACQCNLRFHVRLGSNDDNNNHGNNNYNNNLLLCVCTVPGWCLVQFSLSPEGREQGSRKHILQLA